MKASVYDFAAIDALAREHRVDPGRLHKLRRLLFKRGADFFDAASVAGVSDSPSFLNDVHHAFLEQVQALASGQDNATKLISRTDAGFLIESVVMSPKTGRVALCVSSQVGCAAACRFCATGQMGVARDLSFSEILDQVSLANRWIAPTGKRVRNIVFMGMGEPLHNEEAVCRALSVLLDPKGFAHPASRLLVSTVGVPDALIRTARRVPEVNYALSLHSANQEKRERIIPLARRYPLPVLRDAVKELNQLQGPRKSVMIEHLMLEGLNDSAEDAAALAKWLGGLRVHVNLIPYNPVSTAPDLRSSSKESIEAFGAMLRGQGFPTTIRYSLGRDIDAACGQLVQSENREVARRLVQTIASPTTT